PNKSITSLSLPPRKKAMVQLPPRKVSIIAQSTSIITLEHAAEISSWIDRRSKIYNTTEIPYEFKLLLRGEAFHRLCDDIPGTVVVAKINSTNEILG
ncbi:20371_t:CDS:2, partial [Gigaspora rosea]